MVEDAQAKAGALAGTVRSWLDASPVAGAELTFMGAGSIDSMITDADGRFVFVAAQPGPYTLASVLADDYLPYAPEVERSLAAGASITPLRSSALTDDAGAFEIDGVERAGVDERASRHPWAWLLARVFAVDVTVCPHCAGRMRGSAFDAPAYAIVPTLADACGLALPPPEAVVGEPALSRCHRTRRTQEAAREEQEKVRRVELERRATSGG